MSEKLCLQWNDFQDNVKSAFGNLRESTDFADVTLACEDGHQIEAHKVVLGASSPFFQAILKRNKHSHPLIYMRGMKSVDLVAMVDFLYYGEANVYQENFDSFLKIAEELKLKGLGGTDEYNKLKERDSYRKPAQIEPNPISPRGQKMPTKGNIELEPVGNNAVALLQTRTYFSGDLQQLDETVKSMMETSRNLVSNGKDQYKGKMCKVCGIEGHKSDIMRHIEANHLEGVSIPCNHCEKKLKSRNSLRKHVSQYHKQ